MGWVGWGGMGGIGWDGWDGWDGVGWGGMGVGWVGAGMGVGSGDGIDRLFDGDCASPTGLYMQLVYIKRKLSSSQHFNNRGCNSHIC